MDWVFNRWSRSETLEDPHTSQHFTKDQGVVEAVVRETIQNSLDASVDFAKPVRVRFALHTKKDMPPQYRLKDYFERLEAPLEKFGVPYNTYGAPKLNSGFLVCEDFGTRGLEGDPMFSGLHPPKGKQDFFRFWRNIGRSDKEGDALGRWGLGKSVFQRASSVRSMLGLTVRESDQRNLVMGQAVLKMHEFAGTVWKPIGYWCEKDENADRDTVQRPTEDYDVVEQFRQEWKLTRKKDEPGLSVVVPYVINNMTGESIFKAVAVNFFVPILRQQLIVEIVAPGLNITLTDETIEAECQKINWTGKITEKRHSPPPIAFAKKCLAIAEQPMIFSELWGKENISDKNLAFAKKDLETLRTEFKAGKLVAAKIHIRLLKKESESPCDDFFYVFLQREDRKTSPDSYYIREGMTIPKIKSLKAKANHTRGLVYIDRNRHIEGGGLASLLGDTEGPAHEDWLTSTDRPDEKWKDWIGRVKFVKEIISKFYETVSPRTEKPDRDVLSEFFSLERKDVSDSSSTFKKPDKSLGDSDQPDSTSDTTTGGEPNPKWFAVEDVLGGFRVCHAPLLDIPQGVRLEILLAYDVTKGDPLGQWTKFDFDLMQELKTGGRMRYKVQNAKAKVVSGNSIILRDISNDFSLKITGFDIHRDLYVKVEEIPSEEKEVE